MELVDIAFKVYHERAVEWVKYAMVFLETASGNLKGKRCLEEEGNSSRL